MSRPRLGFPITDFLVAVIVGCALLSGNDCFASELTGIDPAGVTATPQVRGETVGPNSKFSPADKARLRNAAERLRLGIVLFELPDSSGGTGFVISQKHRLVATAGHVADLFDERRDLVAVPDGTRVRYRVERVWYHPGILRDLDKGLNARVDNPKEGEIAVGSPDVAVLQLSRGGAELPGECELASDVELGALGSQLAGLLGYSISDMPCIQRDGTESATFGIFVIDKVANVPGSMGVPVKDRQLILGNSVLGPGASGGPVFLENGHVVGILATGSGKKPSTNTEDQLAIRIDCLRELVAYHKLPGFAPFPQESGRLRPEWEPEPRLGQFRQAVRLARGADALLGSGEYRAASLMCNEAIALAPEYAGAFLTRSRVYLFYLGTHWSALSPDDRLRYADWAYRDSSRCLQSFRERSLPYLIHQQNVIYEAYLMSDQMGFRFVLDQIDKMLQEDWPCEPLTEIERSFALNCRAQCHQFLGEVGKAREDYDESIRLSPEEPNCYLNRAQYWDSRGRRDLAQADRLNARRLRASRQSKALGARSCSSWSSE